MKLGRILGFGVILGVGFGAGWLMRARRSEPAAQTAQGRKVLYWVDPMHPAYKSDKPGIAPDCGMKLEPVYADGGGPESAAPPKGRILYYRDPKQPKYRADAPGVNPETGNDLEPVYENDPSSFAAGAVQISPRKQQLIGVQFTQPEYSDAGFTIRAAGKVAYDETRVAHVHTKFEGWIGDVFADFTGKQVKKGDPLFTIYSPELLATQQELLLAGRARGVLSKSANGDAALNGDSLFLAARRRLELWDLSEAQIRQVMDTGKPVREVTFYSPAGGYVLERKVFPNQKVTPDQDLLTIADLSRVWIMADVFEYEAPNIRLGQPARISVPQLPGKALNARVSYIQPQVDPASRTIKVRLEVANPGLSLKPEMYVDVDFRAGSGRRLTVPAEAVLDSGEQQTVFVDRGAGYFEPRKVITGERLGGRVEILGGLAPGERIVASGVFLLNSESQLKAAAAAMGPPPAGHEGYASAAQAAGQKGPAEAAPGGGHRHD